jgi:hypothetical protein
MEHPSGLPSWYDVDRGIYVDLQDVKANASALGETVKASWPAELSQRINRPTAMLARHIASPNYELLWFVRLARRHGFRALVLEHTSDRFSARNPVKHALARMPIVKARSRNGSLIVRPQKIMEISENEGRPLKEILTYWGENLVSFHHRKLAEALGSDAPDLVDMTQFLPAAADCPANYYRSLFRLLSGYLVLMEDFVADEDTAEFFSRTVLPAWQDAVSDTGWRPQVVRLTQSRLISSPIWNAYPASVGDGQHWLRPRAASSRAG